MHVSSSSNREHILYLEGYGDTPAEGSLLCQLGAQVNCRGQGRDVAVPSQSDFFEGKKRGKIMARR
jgi:hypothetical protein